MSLISIALAVAVLLALIAVGLIGWAYFNPAWQRADAYDALFPFSLGVMLLVASSAIAAVAGIVKLALAL